jgi:hypothetical protein
MALFVCGSGAKMPVSAQQAAEMLSEGINIVAELAALPTADAAAPDEATIRRWQVGLRRLQRAILAIRTTRIERNLRLTASDLRTIRRLIEWVKTDRGDRMETGMSFALKQNIARLISRFGVTT